MIVAVVGSSGSGKTTMAKALEEMGFNRISLDEVARDVDHIVQPRMAEVWPQFFHEGVLDRKAFGAWVFQPENRDALHALNTMYDGPMWDYIRGVLWGYNDSLPVGEFNSRHYVVEGYTYPVGLEPDKVFWVVGDVEDQISRLMAREGHRDREALRARLAYQTYTPQDCVMVPNIGISLAEFQESCREEAEVLFSLGPLGPFVAHEGQEIPCRTYNEACGDTYVRFRDPQGVLLEGWVSSDKVLTCRS